MTGAKMETSEQEKTVRKLLILATLLLAFTTLASAQSAPKPDWSPFNWLIGTWDGSGSGKPGSGGGSFSLLYSLDHAVLVRKNRSDYPATKGQPAIHHQDLMVVYSENDKWRADYWDNERHVIHYAVAIGEGTATFVSDKSATAPTYRLTYKRLAKGDLSIEFAIAPPGSDDFKTYTTGTCHRRQGT